MEQNPSWEANRSSASQKNYPYFMELEGSLQLSQNPVAYAYPEPDQCSSCPQNWHEEDFNITLPPAPGSFLQVSPLKPCMHLSSPQYVLHVLYISVFFIW